MASRQDVNSRNAIHDAVSHNAFTAPVPTPGTNMGPAAERIDGRAKVTGRIVYGSDTPVANPAYAFLVTSAIARGRIRHFDLAAAKAVPGVIDIFTYQNLPKLKPVPHFSKGGYGSTELQPMNSADIVHEGQIIGVVLAETYEAAREAAYRVHVDYDAKTPSAGFDSKGTETLDAAKADDKHKDKSVGHFDTAFAAAPVRLDARYGTPTQHHNPIELFTTTASWSGDELTLHEPSQFVWSLKNGVATALGIDPAKVTVINPYVGGAFGSKGSMTPRTPIIAAIAKVVGRPVKLVATRDQGFTIVTYRAETRHHVRLGAEKSGKLTAFSHEGWELTSRTDNYKVAGTKTTVEMYAVPNIATKVRLVKADRNTPGFMRSPPDYPYMYALESAIDEMAEACGIDPVEFRRINDTQSSPINGSRYTSRSLMQCFDQAAKAFGWSQRTPQPGSMRDGDWLIGQGCATICYPAQTMAATARVRLTADGAVRVQIAAHDVGTGAYTVMAIVASETLGVPIERITVEMGDSRLPPGPVAGGSQTTASAGSAVKMACDKVAARFGNRMPHGDELKPAFAKLQVGSIEEYAEWNPPSSPDGAAKLYEGKSGGGAEGGEQPKLMYAFGAEFVEVRVHRLTREIRVPRITGAFAGGRIINPRTARSQLMGGMIWGIGSALHEATEIDEKRARYVNDNIAEYLIPVNADIRTVEVILVPEVDDQIPLGAKGLGELGNVGTAAAITSAVYHATGKRIRDLPVTIDKLI